MDKPRYVVRADRSDVQFIVATAAELSQRMHAEVFALVEANMRAMYIASSTWDAAEKREEFEYPTSRFLLAVRSLQPAGAATGRLLGFVMWRYDIDGTVPEDPTVRPGDDEVEVAYWYVPPLTQL